MLLNIKNIDVLYDDFQVIWDVSINVKKGEIVALLGPNGSGKSTILNTISNLVSHKNGSIYFEDSLISNVPTHKRTALGISHVLERRRVFPHLTVIQNLLLGAWHPKAKEELENSLKKIYKIFPKLEIRASQLARTMSGGEQQMLAIARALMSRPKLLLLDEPSMGLAPIMVEKIFEVIRGVSKTGVTILLVEQNARLALESSQRAYVMESGELSITGQSNELLHSPKIRSSYLGEGD